MNKQTGFTIIELVAVLVILALLGAMAVPRFFGVTDDALTAAKNGSVAAVRSGHAMAIAKQKRLPTLTELAEFVGGPAVLVDTDGTGIQVTINDTDYIVPTYTDSNCTTATADATDTVGCVGEIPQYDQTRCYRERGGLRYAQHDPERPIRWRIRDLIDFHIDEAVLDIFELPPSGPGATQERLYVAVARSALVQERVDMMRRAGAQVKVVDIRELALRSAPVQL